MGRVCGPVRRLFSSPAQRRGFREYLTGLLLPRDRDKTLTCLAGVLVIDDSGDRKDGTATAHVGRQWLGRLGKTDNGVVTVTTLWADERLYYPLRAVPYTPARHFPKGRSDPGFATKLRMV